KVKLTSIPTFGIPFKFGFYIGTWNYLKHTHTIKQEGYTEYPGRAFKAPFLNKWLVAVSDPAMIEEVQLALKDVLSLSETANSVNNVLMGSTKLSLSSVHDRCFS
ncbi:hypothetical protein B0H17DRAFT_932526, partial [Mycena rosella]